MNLVSRAEEKESAEEIIASRLFIFLLTSPLSRTIRFSGREEKRRALFVSKTFYGLALCALFAAVAVVAAKVPLGSVLRSVKGIIFLLAFTSVLNLFFHGGERLLVQWGIIHIYLEGVLFAVFLMRNLELTPVVFGYVIAFWLLFRSVWGITVSIDLNDYGVRGWGWLLALSVVGVLLAALMLFFPLLAASFIVYLVGFALMLYGVFRIYLGFRLKSLGDEMRALE